MIKIDEQFASDLAWKILDDLSDRAGIPEWIGSRSDPDAVAMHRDLVREVIMPELEGLYST